MGCRLGFCDLGLACLFLSVPARVSFKLVVCCLHVCKLESNYVFITTAGRVGAVSQDEHIVSRERTQTSKVYAVNAFVIY